MLIAGAGRHSKDLMFVLQETQDNLVFFDDVTNPPQEYFLKRFKIISSLSEVKILFKKNNQYVLGLGGTLLRKKINDKLSIIGGEVVNIKAKNAIIGDFEVNLGKGLNIMPYTFISNSVTVGDGSLINTRASLHHDVQVGSYCDLAPASMLLGGVIVGDYTSIGANATILPNIKVGNNCIVGAGSVVTRNISDNSMVVGIPARKVKDLSPLDVSE